MIKKKEVSLSLYNPKISVEYVLPTEQLEFSGMPQDIIKRDVENPLKHLVIIHARDEAAGFLELCELEDRKKYSNKDRKSTRLNSSHPSRSRMPSSA